MIPAVKKKLVYILNDDETNKSNSTFTKLDIDVLKILDILRFCYINFDMK
jgi:hypothetical protein